MDTVTVAELDQLANTSVKEPIPAHRVSSVLQQGPFIPSASLINLRDVGAVPGAATEDPDTSHEARHSHSPGLKSGRFYRCGMLGHAANDPHAVRWITSHVKRIFDLRNLEEVQASPDPDFPGVENVQMDRPSRSAGLVATDFIADGGSRGWKEELLHVSKLYAPVFRQVLLHIKDRPEEPILFHCTAGRDRTGVLAGLLHSLAGSPADVIVRDYMLSRIGTEPARQQLLGYALAAAGVTTAAAVSGEATAQHVLDPRLWPDGFENLISLRPEFWKAFDQGIHEEHGGWDGYVVQELGLSGEELAVNSHCLPSCNMPY